VGKVLKVKEIELLYFALTFLWILRLFV